MNIEKARFNMIEQQVKPWKVFDERLLGAMATLPREKFVSDDHKNLAYADIPIPLGHNQFMLTPREVARMVQALSLTGTEKVLEIGCGSGYTSALLAKLAHKVIAVDIIAEFVQNTKTRLRQLALNNVIIEEADAANGWLSKAPYDAILITSALAQLPKNMKSALKKHGRVVAIIGEAGSYTAKTYQLDDNKEWQIESLFPVDAKPMINADQPNQFVF